MSGPIVRKYGFPNFEAIFGRRDIQHGTAESDQSEPKPEVPPESSPPSPDPNRLPAHDPGSPPGAGATEEQKESEDSAQL